MKIVYIAGSFTHPTPEGICENIRAAARIGHEVRKLGAGAVVPHLIGAPYVVGASIASHADEFGYEWWIEETKELLRRCDALLLIDGWENSSGARGEWRDAVDRCMPVFTRLEDLARWLEETKGDAA
ncbi:MAG TPA: DUF4406 domain-containing protein [Kofleriaceae bacterium]|nr:DUF4406 domain-containing protein [Kofleriaceae bacterium]